MKVSAILILTAASAALAAPVAEANAEAAPAPAPQATSGYTNYGKYDYSKYGSYGTYGAPPATTPSPTPVPQTYSAYGTYKGYKRATDWVKSCALHQPTHLPSPFTGREAGSANNKASVLGDFHTIGNPRDGRGTDLCGMGV
ncbi:hypothetical protein CCUS01_13467 [Colletotrichum cuscutae]|uniref:Secreted protein n=1 Tax=Colletotrichum cuscutae TaxID=1209917 RepID=A0AAI9YBT4_9PEZI|nr:hypothetical protein CCUS01_13467 [Colletotrichum cuscutae]